MKNTVKVFSSCSSAFKEWACTVEALGHGDQSLIIRKGGIQENNGVFAPEHQEFALFPTYEHQKSEDLTASGRHWLESVRLKTGLSEPDLIPLSYFARVQRVLWLDRREKLEFLSSQQVLNTQALGKRFDYGEHKGFFILVLRVYRLRPVILLPRLPAYAGCRSWITLASPLETSALEPVLSETAFTEQCAVYTRLFGN